MDYIPRVAEHPLRENLSSNDVVILLGARQVGKTYLAKRIAKEYKTKYFDLDAPFDNAEFASISALDVAGVMRSLGEPELIVIDEAQREPKVGRIVKAWHDHGMKAKILLTGSSTLQLLDNTAEALTGRNRKIGLTPLTLMERYESESWYKKSVSNDALQGAYREQVESVLLDHMIYGGYPATLSGLDRSLYLKNIVSDYLLRDVLQIGLVREPEIVKKLLLLLAGQIGNEVRISELSNKLEVDKRTVEKYINLLESSYVIFSLPSYGSNPRNEITKGRKIYFWDTGIRNAIIDYFEVSPDRMDIGPLFENVMVAEFAKLNALRGHEFSLYFWRSTAQSEVDLVLTREGKVYAYEAKWAKNSIWAGRAFKERYNAPVTLINKHNILPIIRELVVDIDV